VTIASKAATIRVRVDANGKVTDVHHVAGAV
jgi:hypothetical protein